MPSSRPTAAPHHLRWAAAMESAVAKVATAVRALRSRVRGRSPGIHSACTCTRCTTPRNENALTLPSLQLHRIALLHL